MPESLRSLRVPGAFGSPLTRLRKMLSVPNSSKKTTIPWRRPASKELTVTTVVIPMTIPRMVSNDRKLSELELLRPVIGDLGDRATLHVVEGADHGFHVLKRSGRTDEKVLAEIASTSAAWMNARLGD